MPSALDNPDLIDAVKVGDINRVRGFHSQLNPKERSLVQSKFESLHGTSVEPEEPMLSRGMRAVREEAPGMLKRVVPPIIGQVGGEFLGGPASGIVGGGLGGGLGEYWAEKGELEKGQREKISWPQVALQTGLSAIPPLAIAKSVSLPLRVGLRGLEGMILGGGGTALSEAVEGHTPAWKDIQRGALLGGAMGGGLGGLSEAIRPMPEMVPIKERGLEAQRLFGEHGIEAPLTPGEATTANAPQTLESFLRQTYGGSSAMEKVGYGQYGAAKKVGELIQKKAGGIPTEESAANVRAAYERFNQLENGAQFNPMAFKKGIQDQLLIAGKRAKSSPLALKYLEDLSDEFSINKPGEDIWYHGGDPGVKEFTSGMVTKSKNLAESYAKGRPGGMVYELKGSDIIPATEENLPNVFKQYKDNLGYVKPGAKPIAEKNITVTELNEIRKELGEMIGKAKKADEGNSVRVLTDLKKSIDADFHNIEKGRYGSASPESAAAIREANALNKSHEKMKFAQELLHGNRIDDYDIIGGSVAAPQRNRFYKRLFSVPKKERIRNLGEEGNQLAEALAFYMPNASHALKAISGKGLNFDNLNMFSAPLKTSMAATISMIYGNPTIQKRIIDSYRKGFGVSNKLIDSIYRQTLIKMSDQSLNEPEESLSNLVH